MQRNEVLNLILCFLSNNDIIIDFKTLRANKTVNTIPYSSDIPYDKHQDDGFYEPDNNMKGKKITVVGIGHVGLEVCATILN